MTIKKQLRNEMKEKLRQMADEDHQIFSDKIKATLLKSREWAAAKTIGITISTQHEVDTRSIIEAAWQEGKQVGVPKCFTERKELKFYLINSFNEIEDSFYSLKEPIISITSEVQKAEIDLMIVPGLIFDRLGYRIGFGGGYYDRYLRDFPNQTLSLAFNFQLINEVPKEEFDVPVGKIISNT